MRRDSCTRWSIPSASAKPGRKRRPQAPDPAGGTKTRKASFIASTNGRRSRGRRASRKRPQRMLRRATESLSRSVPWSCPSRYPAKAFEEKSSCWTSATRKAEPTIYAQAWRVEFVEDTIISADGVETIEIAEPRRRHGPVGAIGRVGCAVARRAGDGRRLDGGLASARRQVRPRRSNATPTNGFALAAHGEKRRTSEPTSAPCGSCGTKAGP